MYNKLWTKDFIMITLVNFLMYVIHYTLFVTITNFTINQYHASASIGGLAAGIFIIGMLIGRLIAGRFIDNFQPKTFLIIGIIFSIVTISLYFTINGLYMLMIIRLLHGIGFGFSSTATGAISSTIVPDVRKGEGIGYYALSTTTAAAVGPFIGISVSQNLGFQANFSVCLIIIIMSLLMTIAITKIATIEESEIEKESVSEKGIAKFIQKEAIPISTVIVFIGIAYSSVLSFLTIYTYEINLVTASSWFFIVYAITTFVSRPFTGKIYDAYGENKIMYIVLISFAIGFILLSITQSSILLFISAIFIALGYGTIIPSGQAIAIQQSPKKKIGLATSTFYMLTDLGAGIGPTIIGIIIPLVGYRYLYGLMAILVVFATMLYFLVHGRFAKKGVH
ncbi:MFS transporter [Staphylococcus aureus]|uniref:MFS transporter n=1 Tax=Staphylococcus aureus TaxID=1280 RepID=UPI0018E912ED|nr:MFS transporter [Staphylococcus aureus]MBJ6131150.1 MFS transporter [Staphylococcus aureus]MBJ6141726.1 MFS transporter [Staphylococcus aureus]MBJ6153681.1 MFS transporter [Staphylococcus aureus]MBJ6156493.1 MFS transporter [Staphylococcus aureus]MBJ6159053.1 MFS transporter [Staphylococcus aureus]